MSRIALPLSIAICLMACACSDDSNSSNSGAAPVTLLQVIAVTDPDGFAAYAGQRCDVALLDGSGSDLTGAEANEIYGSMILPVLLRHQSQPRAFLNSFVLNPGSPEALQHKAAVENTLVYVSESEFAAAEAFFVDNMHLYRYSEVLDAPLQVPDVDGIAEVLTDDLRNTYQRIP